MNKQKNGEHIQNYFRPKVKPYDKQSLKALVILTLNGMMVVLHR